MLIVIKGIKNKLLQIVNHIKDNRTNLQMEKLLAKGAVFTFEFVKGNTRYVLEISKITEDSKDTFNVDCYHYALGNDRWSLQSVSPLCNRCDVNGASNTIRKQSTQLRMDGFKLTHSDISIIK